MTNYTKADWRTSRESRTLSWTHQGTFTTFRKTSCRSQKIERITADKMSSRSQSRAKHTQTIRNFDKEHTTRKKVVPKDDSKEITIPRGDGPFPKKRGQKIDSPTASPVKETTKQPAEEPKQVEKTQEMIDTYNRLKQEIEEKQKKVATLTKQRDRLIAKAKAQSQEYKYEPEEEDFLSGEEEETNEFAGDHAEEEETLEVSELEAVQEEEVLGEEEEEKKTDDAETENKEDDDIDLSDVLVETLDALEEEEEILD